MLHSPVAPPPARLAAAEFLVMLLSHVGPEAAAAAVDEAGEAGEAEEEPHHASTAPWSSAPSLPRSPQIPVSCLSSRKLNVGLETWL